MEFNGGMKRPYSLPGKGASSVYLAFLDFLLLLVVDASGSITAFGSTVVTLGVSSNDTAIPSMLVARVRVP